MVGLVIALTALVVARVADTGSTSLDPASSAAAVGMVARDPATLTASPPAGPDGAPAPGPTRAATQPGKAGKVASRPTAKPARSAPPSPSAAASSRSAGHVTSSASAGATSSALAAGLTTDLTVAAQVVTLTNAQRATAGCPALTLDGRLTAAAEAHSVDMAVHNYFGHNSQVGTTPFQRMVAAGYNFTVAAENIAAGQTTPAAVMAAWMASPGHRANILNCALRQIGVGFASGGTYGSYWTQDFGTP
ncbi:MAG: CAP domain-containing protein [Frankia sp.]